MAFTAGPALQSPTPRTRSDTEIAVHGDIDLASAPALETRLLAALEAGPARLVVDLSRVDFVDSTGVHLLERVRREAAERGVALVVMAPAGPARRVFALSGRDGLLAPPAPLAGDLFLTEWAG